MRKQAVLVLSCLMCMGVLHSQEMSREEYVDKFKDIAIRKMAEFKIPASITLAQGILESGSGNSKLAQKANNHFGIKCHKGWTGKTFYQDDDLKNECFRKYDNPEESFKDHSYFLTTRDRYAGLFTLEITDYKAWAKGLKDAGYATNPRYPEILIKIIEENKLYEYDQLTLSLEGEFDEVHGSNFFIVKAGDYKAIAKMGKTGRNVYQNNNKRFIIAEEGDDFQKIAEDFNMYAWQLYKYNDLSRNDRLKAGQMIYLQRKRNKAETGYHLLNKGETMYAVSQKYGIKLKKLYSRNGLEPGKRPQNGTRLKLK